MTVKRENLRLVVKNSNLPLPTQKEPQKDTRETVKVLENAENSNGNIAKAVKKPTREWRTESSIAGVRTRRNRALIKERVLEELGRVPVITLAAKAAGTSRATVTRWVDQDANFRRKFELATAQGVEMLEGNLWDRCAYGWPEPIYQSGHLVGYKQVHDNTNAIRLLAAKKPEYSNRVQAELSGPGGSPLNSVIQVAVTIPQNGRIPPPEEPKQIPENSGNGG